MAPPSFTNWSWRLLNSATQSVMADIGLE
jgi:hypothetical protein